MYRPRNVYTGRSVFYRMRRKSPRLKRTMEYRLLNPYPLIPDRCIPTYRILQLDSKPSLAFNLYQSILSFVLVSPPNLPLDNPSPPPLKSTLKRFKGTKFFCTTLDFQIPMQYASDISKYEFFQINTSKIKISQVYTIRSQRNWDEKNLDLSKKNSCNYLSDLNSELSQLKLGLCFTSFPKVLIEFSAENFFLRVKIHSRFLAFCYSPFNLAQSRALYTHIFIYLFNYIKIVFQ